MTDSATITREDAGKDVPVTKLAIASTIGTIIEAYDFVLYGTVAALSSTSSSSPTRLQSSPRWRRSRRSASASSPVLSAA